MDQLLPRPASHLLRLPAEIMFSFIFPHLNQNELLRMRRVCKQLQTNSNDYILNNFSDNEREINETNFTLNDFISCDLPTKRIYLNNSGPEFFNDPVIPEFLQLYSSTITHLRVKHFQSCYSEAEDNFFSSLTNLRHLELEHTYFVKKSSFKFLFKNSCFFPETFENLLTLKFGTIYSDEGLSKVYFSDFIEFCVYLEFLKHPIFQDVELPKNSFLNLGDLQKQREWQSVDVFKLISLKYYDIQNYMNEQAYEDDVSFNILNECVKNNVKLLNVEAEVIEANHEDFENTDFCKLLVSVQNICKDMAYEEMPNMERLVLISTMNYRDFYDPDMLPPSWPKVKSLDIFIRRPGMSHWVEDASTRGNQIIQNLYRCLFNGEVRNILKDLSIRFDKNSNALLCPRVRNIVNCCKNITKLTLSNWMGTNKAVVIFWDGLPLLEEVFIDECPTVSNLAFLGMDKKDPIFLKLIHLKSLTLSGLDSMPLITNVSFRLVFKHLKIKKFYITSRRPLKSVTAKGIKSLSRGEFNNHVEKFPFQEWSLEDFSAEEFSQLKSKFRASYML